MSHKINHDVPKLKVPDMRFNYIFTKSLEKEMMRQGKDAVTYYILGKVILRDIIIIPFLQNMIWTGALITLKDPIKKYCSYLRQVLFPTARKYPA